MTTIDDFVLNFVLNTLWQAALVTAVAAFGARLLLRKASAHYRYIVWVTVLVLSVLLPLWSALPGISYPLMMSFSPIPITIPYVARPSETRPIEAPAVSGGQRSNNVSIPLGRPFKGFFAGLYLLFLLFRLNRLWRAWRRTLAIRKSAYPVAVSEALQDVINHCRCAILCFPPVDLQRSIDLTSSEID